MGKSKKSQELVPDDDCFPGYHDDSAVESGFNGKSSGRQATVCCAPCSCLGINLHLFRQKSFHRLKTTASKVLSSIGYELPVPLNEEQEILALEHMSIQEIARIDKNGRHRLHVAAQLGQPSVCSAILKIAQENPPSEWCSLADKSGRTALHLAVENGHAESCEVLLSSPCFTSADEWNNKGMTALHLAANAGRAEVCNTLLCTRVRNVDAGAFSRLMGFHQSWAFTLVDVQDRSGHTALHHAAISGHADCVETLCSQSFRHVDVCALDSKGGSALHRAAEKGNLEVCKQLLLCRGARSLCDLVDSEGNTALHSAAKAGHARVCKALLVNRNFHGANNSHGTGRTAFHEAAAAGHLEACRAMSNARCVGVMDKYPPFTAFAAQDLHGRTALHLAVSGGYVDLVQVMLDSLLPSDAINVQDNDGRTVLHYASIAGNAQIFQIILDDRFFELEEQLDNDGNAALDLATGDVLLLMESLSATQQQRLQEASLIHSKFV